MVLTIFLCLQGVPAPTPAIQEVEAVEVVEGIEVEVEVEQEMETSCCLPIAGAQSSGAFPLVINNGQCLCTATSCHRLWEDTDGKKGHMPGKCLCRKRTKHASTR